jgi:hypothetical protein
VLKCIVNLSVQFERVCHYFHECGSDFSFFWFLKQNIHQVTIACDFSVTPGCLCTHPHVHDEILSFRIVLRHQWSKALVANNVDDSAACKVRVHDQFFVLVHVVYLPVKNFTKGQSCVLQVSTFILKTTPGLGYFSKNVCSQCYRHKWIVRQ